MHLGAASAYIIVSGRATDWMRGLRRLSSPDKLRMGTIILPGVRAWVLRSMSERERTQTIS